MKIILLDVIWIMIILKNYYRLISVDLSREKKLDADAKAIQQIEFVEKFKKLHTNDSATDARSDESMFVLLILEKVKETRLKFSQESVTVL